MIFYYDPIIPGKHAVNFVEAGTETSGTPTLVKTFTVEADQTVVTPRSAAAKELTAMGYALVNKDGGQYKTVKNAEDLNWIDEKGDPQLTATLKGDAIPYTITYLVQPIPYTITYENAAGSPAAADGALNAVTAAAGTPVASAGDKNPTQYTTKDDFTAKTPARVYENGRWYKFSRWTLGDETTVKAGNGFKTLRVEPGTVGNLAFIAHWEEVTDTGSLTVSKKVAGEGADTDKKFSFTVTLKDDTISGAFGEVTFTNGRASFELKHGESKTASNLPAGTNYVVEEQADKDYDSASAGAVGTITGEGVTAAFTNTRKSSGPGPGPDPDPSGKKGGLTVTKTVSGSRGDTSRDFTFEVKLGDTSVEGQYGDMTFHAGVAVFTLKHGGSMTAKELPAGIRYTVEESDNAGYTVTSSGSSGTIAAGVTLIAQFNNHRSGSTGGSGGSSGGNSSRNDRDDYKPIPASGSEAADQPVGPGMPGIPDRPAVPTDAVPKTGDETNLALWLVLMGLSCVGAVSTWVFSRKQKKRERHRG